jgi:glycosyltransferase involved in cell wall biosynthesis
MLNLLQAAGILANHEPHLIVLDPPFRHFAQSRGAHWLKGRILSVAHPVIRLLDVLWYIWQCWRAIRRYKPEIVHPLLTGVYLSLLPLSVHSEIAYVMSAYSYQFVSYRDRRVLGVSIGATAKLLGMQRCQAIDALSMSIRDELVALGIDSDKTQVAPCSFTNLSAYQPGFDKRKWVVFLGRFVDFKNPLLLAQAIPKVLTQDPDVYFFFLGKGYLQSELESLVQELHVADRVTIRFEVHPSRILSQSIIFVSLQTEENYPSQSLLEAMACANAIVATDVGETWRLVDDINGVRVLPTADAVSNAIIKLLQDPELIQRGQDSRQRVLMEHTPERFLDYMVKLYQTATARAKK